MSNFSLRFFRIDNQAQVVINNSVVWDSGVIHQNPALNKVVSLDKWIPASGKVNVIVRLHNASGSPQSHNPWEIHYQLEKDGEAFGFVHEKSNGNSSEGWQFERTHCFPF